MSNDRNHLKAINRRHEYLFGMVLSAFLIIITVLGGHQKVETTTAGKAVKKPVADAELSQKINAAEHYDLQLDESRRSLIDALENPDLQTRPTLKAADSLIEYCDRRDYLGYDPYDALNSILNPKNQRNLWISVASDPRINPGNNNNINDIDNIGANTNIYGFLLPHFVYV